MIRIFTFIVCSIALFCQAQNNNQVFYLKKTTSKEVFYDVKQLSNNTLLVAGACSNMSWVPTTVAITTINLPDTVKNGTGSNKIPFLMQLSADLTTILQVVRLNTNDAEDIRYLKFTNEPGSPTGTLYISGNTSDTKANDGGYFIGKLNNNFVSGVPIAFAWAVPVYAATGSYIQSYHPWDVSMQGLYYATGESHAANWAAIYSLSTSTGNRQVVNNWLTHWYTPTGTTVSTEYKYATANTFNTSVGTLQYSGIPLKHGRCDLRSMNAADYNSIANDENNYPRMGKMPWDFLFKSECDPANVSNAGKGYNDNINGYRIAGSTSFVYGITTITCDKRNNWIYLGLNTKSSLPDGLPDFEPVVVALNNGSMGWWARCYKESNDGINPLTSTPDQYIDAIAIDYSKPQAIGELVVAARQHGNNTNALWNSGPANIAANPTATGFKNRFMGSNGNIHICWLGRLRATTGTLLNATYVAELVEGAANYGIASADPHLDGWPSPNSGNADLNTTYIKKNQLQITGDGHVLALAQGRRTLTTANAYQKMPFPSSTLKGSWNHFVRQYRHDLSYAKYSSILTGQWDVATGAGGDNVQLNGICKTEFGIIAVGQGNVGNAMPTSNIPTWGASTFSDSTAVIAYFKNDSIASINDRGLSLTVVNNNKIELLSNCNNGTTTLSWKPKNDYNNYPYYDIEYTANGILFTSIHRLYTSPQVNTYTYNPAYQKGRYRLKFVSNNGAVTYSNIVSPTCASVAAQMLIDAPRQTVSFYGLTKPTHITLYNQSGQLIYSAYTANSTYTFALPRLSSGLYYCKLLQANNTRVEKIIL